MKAQATATAAQEKRREHRYPTKDQAEVRVFPYTMATVPATILDVSKSGMKLELATSLARNEWIEVLMPFTRLVVFGVVRYCRREGAVYHAGVLIEDVAQPKRDEKHVHDDEISLYVVGKGLSAAEVLRIEDHMSRCAACKQRIVQTANTLYPKHPRSADL